MAVGVGGDWIINGPGSTGLKNGAELGTLLYTDRKNYEG